MVWMSTGDHRPTTSADHSHRSRNSVSPELPVNMYRHPNVPATSRSQVVTPPNENTVIRGRHVAQGRGWKRSYICRQVQARH